MKPFLFSLFALFSFFSYTQNEIEWSFDFDSKTSEIKYTATLKKDWHVYSTKENDGGPVPTQFELKPSNIFQLNGVILEPKPTEEFDPNFNMTVYHFSNMVTFSQKIDVIEKGEISGSVVYMICNDQMCFPPEEKQFKIQIAK